MLEAATSSRPSVPGLRSLLAVGVLFLVPACGGGDEAASTDMAAASDDTTHAHDGSGEHSHDGPGAHTHVAADTLASGIRLAPGPDHGWTGSATLLTVGDSVRALVSVEGSDAGARHRVELVAGGCEDPGTRLATLTPVAAGSSGAGSSQSTLLRSRMAEHAHGALRLGDADGAWAACAPVHLGAEHDHE